MTEQTINFGNASEVFMIDVMTAANKFSSASTSDKVSANLRRLATCDGRFTGQAPYGYQNIRIDGKAIVRIHPEHGQIVRRIFELYAFHNHTVDSLIEALEKGGVAYRPSQPKFNRSNVWNILRNRSYIGEVPFHDQWYQGKHESLIDRTTFDRVQVLLGNKLFLSHEVLYGSELITCAHCGHPVTAEVKTKKTKAGEARYVYYRCAQYNREGHPNVRLREEEIDAQMISFFRALKMEDENALRWYRRVLLESNRSTQKEDQGKLAEIKRQHANVAEQEDKLLNLRLMGEIDEETYARKATELRDRRKHLELEMEANGRQRDENADLAIKAFELSQSVEEKWVGADYHAKRRILEILCLNFSLDGVTLVPTIRKPFGLLAKGLSVQSGRGDWI